MSGDPLAEADQLLLEAASGARRITEIDVLRVREHVAQAGFVRDQPQIARGKLVGVSIGDRIIQRGETLTTAEAHYLKHVILARQWPDGTTLAAYLASCRAVIKDPLAGIVVSQFRTKGWQASFLRRSQNLRGPSGEDWTVVEYRLGKGWITAFQTLDGEELFSLPERTNVRWLQRPR